MQIPQGKIDIWLSVKKRVPRKNTGFASQKKHQGFEGTNPAAPHLDGLYRASRSGSEMGEINAQRLLEPPDRIDSRGLRDW